MSNKNNFFVFCLILILIQNNINLIFCSPVKSSDSNTNDNNDDNLASEDNNSVTEHGMNSITRPSTKIVDLDNLDASNLEYFRTNNINLTALRVQQEMLRSKKLSGISQTLFNAPAPLTQTGSLKNDEDEHRREYEAGAIDMIKTRIETAVIRDSSKSTMYTSGMTEHEIAFYADCEVPQRFNDTVWFSGNTWNIYFKLPKEQKFTLLQSAVLRIYKTSESKSLSAEAKNCTDNIEQLLRIKVYVYERRRKRGNSDKSIELRKKECSSTTISQKYEGWVEMDIKLAMKQWDKPHKNLGLAVEVQDINDNYLRTLDFFEPVDCTQASKPFPWASYEYFSYTSHEMVSLPKYPRIDIKWKTQPSVDPQMYHYHRYPRHNSHPNSHFPVHNNNNNHHHNHHRVVDDLLQNSAESHSHEGHSEEIVSNNYNKMHKKRHFQHKMSHSYQKSSKERDNLDSKEIV
uniref:CSON010091 protein n=1 Tax=Culicoides sonorensis TaxID=179676 RepID=A0A336LPD3_CULSO